MASDLVPELHDIGKLYDERRLASAVPSLRLQTHRFGDLAKAGFVEPVNMPWWAIRWHHGSDQFPTGLRLFADPERELPRWARSFSREQLAELFLLVVADHLASSTSRSLRRELEEKELGLSLKGRRDEAGWPETSRVVQTIWKDFVPRDKQPALPIADAATFRELIEFLSNDPDWQPAKDKYHACFQRVPEDKGFPRDVTSLLTHCELVGKFYRVLRSHSKLDERKKALVYNRVEARTVDEIEKQWTFRLLECHVHFPQRPARAKDLGIFQRLDDALRALARGDTKNYILLHTLDTVWLFLPAEEAKPLGAFLEPLLSKGFYVRVEAAIEGPVGSLSSDAASLWSKRDELKDKESKQRIKALKEPYPLSRYRADLPDAFPPHICELCQMGPAKERPVLDEKGGIVEYLCENCHGIREESRNLLPNLGGKWEEQDATVAWVRVRMDYGGLSQELPRLFGQYIDERMKDLPQGKRVDSRAREELVENLRQTALLVDFTADYHRFLATYIEAVRETFQDRVEQITDRIRELLVVKMDSGSDVLEMAQTFADNIQQTFPKCLDNSPVKLGVSISNAKYPFFEHWRYLEEPKGAINIQMVGRGSPLELSIPRFQQLRKLKLEEEQSSTALHRAAAIEARSGSTFLAQVELLDKLPKESKLHLALFNGFEISDLLAYHKLATWREQR